MGYVIVILAAYLMGSSSMAFYLSRLKKVDARQAGSGNLGASNVTVLMGWPAGIAVAVHDIGKGVLAVVLAGMLFPQLPHIGAAAGVACVLGHIFPFYLKFRGGKGLASYLGMTLALNWKFALVVMALVLLVTLITDYIALGTLTTVVVVPAYLGIAGRSVILAAILLVATLVMIFKHRDNLMRIRNGTEIGLRSTAKGENRIS